MNPNVNVFKQDTNEYVRGNYKACRNVNVLNEKMKDVKYRGLNSVKLTK